MSRIGILLGLTLLGSAAFAPTDGVDASAQKEEAMTARGTFEVKVEPQPADEGAGPFGRLLLSKQFHGDLEGSSQGQMLGAQTAVEGSGAYIALELVTGNLQGKRGSFMLQHNGTMRKGDYKMNVTVVPDSGTEALTGISGKMTIVIEGKKHSYELEYTLGGI